MMREIDPKTLKKAAPRPPDPKPIEQLIVIPDFPGVKCLTGKVGEANPGKFSVWPETLDAQAVTSTYTHPKKTKVFSVIHGELTLVFDNSNTLLLKVGQSTEVDPVIPYRLEARNGPCVFLNIQDPSYSHRLQINEETQQSGIPADVHAYLPAPRYRSKALDQLRGLAPPEPFREGTPTGDPGMNDMPTRFEDGTFL